MKISVKRNPNCEEMPETEFIRVGSTNSGLSLVYNLDTAAGRPLRTFQVIGFMADGSRCDVHAVRAVDPNRRQGILIYSGDGGIRILAC